MTDPNTSRLTSLITHKIVKAATELGVTNIDAFVSEMLITHAKVSEAFPDVANRQQQLDELLQIHEIIEVQHAEILNGLEAAGFNLEPLLTPMRLVDDGCELVRYAADAATKGLHLGQVEALPEYLALQTAPLKEVAEEVAERNSRKLRNRVTAQGSATAANANTVHQPA
jgi:hypothetical protein